MLDGTSTLQTPRSDPGRGCRELRVVLVGFGAINRRVAELLRARGRPVRIVAVGTRRPLEAVPGLPDARPLTAPAELRSVEPDIVVEAAGREAVLPWGEAALASGGRFVVSSASAFTDDAVFEGLKRLAASRGGHLVISPGAVAGMDALAAGARLPVESLVHRIVKPAAGWRGTAAEDRVDLAGLREATVFFTGSAREAAIRFPANANAAVAVALAAGLGLDAARVELMADPTARANRHAIAAAGRFGTLAVEVENRPLAANPRSSELAALALVRLVEDAVPGVSA